jgi:hypothetical protein
METDSITLMFYYFMPSSVSLSMPSWKNWESHSRIRKNQRKNQELRGNLLSQVSLLVIRDELREKRLWHDTRKHL